MANDLDGFKKMLEKNIVINHSESQWLYNSASLSVPKKESCIFLGVFLGGAKYFSSKTLSEKLAIKN